jgi:hypothetical protein
MKLACRQLTNHEKDRLLENLYPLIKYLGAPGDWGYGTELAKLTIYLHELKQEIIKQPVNSGD